MEIKENLSCNKIKWGGQRANAGRKRTCLKKIPFNRRINENILNILKNYALKHNITETEALESAIMLQNNIDKLKGDKIMKIAIPTEDEKLCPHFGHSETFTFVEVNTQTKEILSLETKAPEEGISCQSAGWISEQGVNVVLAGGIGARPQEILSKNGVLLISGCPTLPIKELVEVYLNSKLVTGENTCESDHTNCHGHNHHCHKHGN